MSRFERVIDITHDIGATGSVRVRTASGEVQVRAVDGTEARVRARLTVNGRDQGDADRQFDDAEPVVSKAAGELQVEPARQAIRASGVSLDIEADVPRLARLHVATASGDVRTDGFAGEQRVETVSGDATLMLETGTVAVTAVSGDVEIRAQRHLSVECTSTSGDVEIGAQELTAVAVRSVSGDVHLEGRLATGEEHRVETVSGDLELETGSGVSLEVRGVSPDVHGDGLQRLGRGSYRMGDGAARVSFRTVSGDVHVSRDRRRALLEGSPRAFAPASSPPPAPPEPPLPPVPPLPYAEPDDPGTNDDALYVLHALERGEIDVDEASRRLGAEEAGV